MRALLRWLNLSIGVAFIAVAVMLAQFPWIAITQPPGSDAFLIIQFHFFVNGAFALAAAFFRKRGLIVLNFVILSGIANIALALDAIGADDPGLKWPICFVVASLTTIAFLMADERPAEPPEGEPENNRASAGAFKVLLLTMVVILTTSILLFAGAIYLELLRAAIFDGAAISLQRIFDNLAKGAANDAVMRLVITIVATVAVFAVMSAMASFISRLMNRKYEAAGSDMSRALTPAEEKFAMSSAATLDAYLGARDYEAKWRMLYAIGVFGVIASFIGVPAVLMAGEGLANPLLEASRANAGAPIYYSGAALFGGMVGGFFAGALVFWSIYQYLGARHPEFGEYLFVMTGWNSLESRPRTLDEIMVPFERLLRAGKIDIENPCAPAEFLSMAFRERESFIYKSAALSVVLAALLTAADLSTYQLVDDEGVSYSNYLQFKSARTDLRDLDRVELRCALYRSEDDDKEIVRASYRLVKDGAFKVDLFDRAAEGGDRLARIEALDARLAAIGVERRRDKDAGIFNKSRPGFIENCAAEISREYDEPLAARLNALLGVDDPASPRPTTPSQTGARPQY